MWVKMCLAATCAVRFLDGYAAIFPVVLSTIISSFEFPDDDLGTMAESQTNVSPGALRCVRCSPIIFLTVLGADRRHTGQVFTMCLVMLVESLQNKIRFRRWSKCWLGWWKLELLWSSNAMGSQIVRGTHKTFWFVSGGLWYRMP